MQMQAQMEGTTVRKSPLGTIQEVAEFLRLSHRSVQNLQSRGLLKTVYFGKKRLFRWADVERLAKNGAR